jgi:hypothetical protein
MKILPFKKEVEPTTEDKIIEYIENREKIGTITGAVKMGIFFAAIGLFMTIMYGWMAFGIPNLIHSVMGV